jgi:hypothetical protein
MIREEEYGLRVFQNKVLRKVFGYKRKTREYSILLSLKICTSFQIFFLFHPITSHQGSRWGVEV